MNDRYRHILKIVRNMRIEKNRNGEILNENEREALRYIIKHPQCILNDVVWYLNVNKALVSRICKKLNELGYIAINSGNDKRKKYLMATKLGQEYKEKSQNFEHKYFLELFQGIDDKKLEVFFDVLEVLYLRSKKRRKEYESNALR